MKKLIIILAACLMPLLAGAQRLMSAKDMIAITPMLSSEIDLPEDAARALELKLGQMATQNGFGSTGGQFILTSNVVTLSKDATQTAPAQFLINLEVSFYVLNVMEGVVIDETSFTVQGIDRLENKAVIQAINQINARSPKVRTFMDNVREKIIDYYNTRIPTLITKAQAMADRNDYYGALAVLAAVPEQVDQYALVADRMTAIYSKMIDREAASAIQEAKSLIALRDYSGALDALMGVDPSSSRSAEAMGMIGQIKSSLDVEFQKEAEQKEREYADFQKMMDKEYELEKLRIDAAKSVGLVNANADAIANQKLNEWFLGMFR